MDIAERLKKVNEEINSKFGTESYEIRCKIYDIHKEMYEREKSLKASPVVKCGNCDSVADLDTEEMFCLKCSEYVDVANF